MTTTDQQLGDKNRTDRPEGYVDPCDEDHVVCDYCGAPFVDEEQLALHHGLEHDGQLTDDERDAYESATDAEAEELRFFRLKALAVLVALYFVLLLSYSVFA